MLGSSGQKVSTSHQGIPSTAEPGSAGFGCLTSALFTPTCPSSLESLRANLFAGALYIATSNLVTLFSKAFVIHPFLVIGKVCYGLVYPMGSYGAMLMLTT